MRRPRACWHDSAPQEVDTMIVTHEFWRDRTTGEHWAVELTDGDVTACAGPLSLDDVNMRYLPRLDYSKKDAAHMQRVRERFELVPEGELLFLDGE
jgi:hypothetical protein